MKGFLLNERAYWRDPTQVAVGLIWLVVGAVIGFVIGALFA